MKTLAWDTNPQAGLSGSLRRLPHHPPAAGSLTAPLLEARLGGMQGPRLTSGPERQVHPRVGREEALPVTPYGML